MCAVQAIRNSRLAAIPKETVLRQMERHPELVRAITRVLFERQTFLESQILLAHEPVPIRLAAALMYLHHKFGAVLPITRAEIGEVAGTTPETTMRVLKKFEHRGFLRESKRRQVVIGNVAALYAELAGTLPDIWPVLPDDEKTCGRDFL
ncbi:MAG: Crp/Fnr family transcriptional regulator [bacterium]